MAIGDIVSLNVSANYPERAFGQFLNERFPFSSLSLRHPHARAGHCDENSMKTFIQHQGLLPRSPSPSIEIQVRNILWNRSSRRSAYIPQVAVEPAIDALKVQKQLGNVVLSICSAGDRTREEIQLMTRTVAEAVTCRQTRSLTRRVVLRQEMQSRSQLVSPHNVVNYVFEHSIERQELRAFALDLC